MQRLPEASRGGILMGSREQILAIVERQEKAGVLVQYTGILEGPAREIIWRP